MNNSLDHRDDHHDDHYDMMITIMCSEVEGMGRNQTGLPWGERGG